MWTPNISSVDKFLGIISVYNLVWAKNKDFENRMSIKRKPPKFPDLSTSENNNPSLNAHLAHSLHTTRTFLSTFFLLVCFLHEDTQPWSVGAKRHTCRPRVGEHLLFLSQPTLCPSRYKRNFSPAPTVDFRLSPSKELARDRKPAENSSRVPPRSPHVFPKYAPNAALKWRDSQLRTDVAFSFKMSSTWVALFCLIAGTFGAEEKEDLSRDVKFLQEQVKLLLEHRQEDYNALEESLKRAMEKNTELFVLRDEVKQLR